MKVRTHRCGELTKAAVGQIVVLNGWVQKRRDHGTVMFIDLRDRTGITQVVFNAERNAAVHQASHALRSECVVSVTGQVMARPEESKNPNLPTGEIEVFVDAVEILNESKTPPFVIEDDAEVTESIRLKYRYLDLRRPKMQRLLSLRHDMMQAVRGFLNAERFLEVETPILTKSTPEGARDYLVPSRVNPGQFFALPQSPQLFKQVLMVSGVDRYYQIARCFRDEDLRNDRQPEFTQIDAELSFADREQVMSLMEKMIVTVFREAGGVQLPTPFPRMTYAEAVGRYGSDKPDLRFDMPLHDVTSICGGQRVQGVQGGGDQGRDRKGLDRKRRSGHAAKQDRCARRNGEEFWREGARLAQDHSGRAARIRDRQVLGCQGVRGGPSRCQAGGLSPLRRRQGRRCPRCVRPHQAVAGGRAEADRY